MYSYNTYDSYYSNPAEEFLNSLFSDSGVMLAGGILVGVLIMLGIMLILSLILYILTAFPLYKLAKKLNRPYAWLAWIPICGVYFRQYVLCDLAGDKELVIIPDKLVIKNRKNSFWIYVAISVLGGIVVGTIIGLLSFIPVIGWLSYILVYIPIICTGIMDYAYLRDVLDIFKEDKSSNNTTSIVVTALDCFVAGGIARLVILFTLLKREPIIEPAVSYESAPVYETPYYAAPENTAPENTAPENTVTENTAPVYEAAVSENTNTDDNAQ